METLTIKELAAYLPYFLKGIFIDKIDVVTSMDNEHDLISGVNSTVEIKNFKPILRPLSDLTKMIEVNGEDFVPYEHSTFVEAMIANEYLEYLCEAKASLAEDRLLPYSIVQLLFEWHFDVFGLIEKGLAKDLNTIKETE